VKGGWETPQKDLTFSTSSFFNFDGRLFLILFGGIEKTYATVNEPYPSFLPSFLRASRVRRREEVEKEGPK